MGEIKSLDEAVASLGPEGTDRLREALRADRFVIAGVLSRVSVALQSGDVAEASRVLTDVIVELRWGGDRPTSSPPPDVVYVAAPEDQFHLYTLEKHLNPTLKQLKMTDWHVGKAAPRDDPETALLKAVSGARVVVLLVTPGYLADPVCRRAEAAALSLSVRVCPVHVKAVDPYHYSNGWIGEAWKSQPFGRLAVLPSRDNKAPVTVRRDQDVAWTEVAAAIRSLLKQLRDRGL